MRFGELPIERKTVALDGLSQLSKARFDGPTEHKICTVKIRSDLQTVEFETMLFLLTNRTRANLSATQYSELAALAKAFYASIPTDVRIRGEWAAVDQSHNYSLLEAPDIDTVQRLQAPFELFTESTIVPVTAISGWTAS